MKRKSQFLPVAIFLVILLLAGSPLFAGGTKEGEAAEPEGPVSFALWTQEGESEGVYQWIVSLTQEFMEKNPDIKIDTVQKDTEALREDFQTASLAGEPPELLWTVNDHAGPFTAAGLIQPVDNLYDKNKFVESVVMEGKTWAVPISSGNHLMLLYNKSLVQKPPETTDELIEMGKQLTKGDTYGLVYNQIEPFWLVPWLGGFGGKVFADDGVTPTLNTPEMVNTLQFLYDLKFKHKIVPPESDYGTMDTLFKEGKAAMIINGDWSLGDYASILKDKLGVAKLPKVSQTGKYPAPYTSGKYFMIAEDVTGAQLTAVKKFMDFVTSEDVQQRMLKTFKRLPALLTVLKSPEITSDPILKGSSEQLAYGTPMPSVVEMRANWDAMKPEMNAVLAGSKTPKDAALAMQKAAEAGIEALK
ncbi:MAG: sugar ABC transporter substrate-binding protein [Spirochaetes bacterium]|nr:MAG: sugar ABC transporter substrate-binding protein [Spirochaetota bacterium]